jgi:hypothetical protein
MNVVELAAEYGVPNLRFFIPMRRLEFAGLIPGIAFKSSNTPEEIVECALHEGRYKVLEDYKVTLRAIDAEKYGQEHFYASDLSSLFKRSIEEGDRQFRVFVVTEDGYSELTHLLRDNKIFA